MSKKIIVRTGELGQGMAYTHSPLDERDDDEWIQTWLDWLESVKNSGERKT